jgi:hypothetical protein
MGCVPPLSLQLSVSVLQRLFLYMLYMIHLGIGDAVLCCDEARGHRAEAVINDASVILSMQ